MAKFDIRDAAVEGLILEVDGQKFHLISVEPYTRKDGTASSVARWEAGCARCGDHFEVTTGTYGDVPVRRCAPCRKIAQGKVKKRRGGAVEVKVVKP